MTLSENRRLRLLTLCLLYMAQGIPWGFVGFTLSSFLTEQGMPAADTARLVGISIIPWTFKWAWGPLIDSLGTSRMGRRRPWILFAQLGMAGSIFAMLTIDDLTTALSTLIVLVFIHNIFNSLQDVCVDALAVDLLEEDERGFANGLMYGSKYLGGAIGGAGLANLVAPYGMAFALQVQVAILSLIFLFPLLLRERPGDRLFARPQGSGGVSWLAYLAGARERATQLFGWLWKAFSVRSSWLAAIMVLGLGLGNAILDKITEAHLIQQVGWTAEEWVNLAGGKAVFLGLGASIAGGWLADRFGSKRVIALAAVGLTWSWLAFAATEPYWASRAWITVLVLVGTGLTAVMSVAFFALAMGLSWPKVAATQFTAYMALSNYSSVLGYRWSGAFDLYFGITRSFVVCAFIGCLSVLILQGIDPGQARRELGDA